MTAALITGATSGIGLEFARQLAARGTSLMVVARDRTRLEDVATSLRAAHKVEVHVVGADLATDAGIDAVVALLSSGTVDLLVHNAGFGSKGPLATSDDATQEAMLRLHVVALHRLARAALPGMVARGRGAIVAVSSVASFTTSAFNVNYCATKSYQRVFMESLALELEGTGVRAQALCPGFTRTEFHQRGRMTTEGIPAWLWLEAPRVVRDSLAALDHGGPVVVVPGRRWQAIVWAIRHLPRRLMRRGARRYQRTRQG